MGGHGQEAQAGSQIDGISNDFRVKKEVYAHMRTQPHS